MTSTAALLLAADRLRPRSQQTEPGMSELGTCRRRVGYKLAETPPCNEQGSVQAVIGSAVHDQVQKILEKQLPDGWLIEHEVHLAGLTGHLDRYEADRQTVVDLKTTSSRWLDHIKVTGPEISHVWQVSCYAAALVLEGHPVSHVEIQYLCRDSGEEYVWAQPFNPADVRQALAWLREINETVRDGLLGLLPRDYEPDSAFCRGCAFGGDDGGICWEGHVPDRDLRSVLYLEDPNPQRWVEQLWWARQDAKDAKKRETEAKGALDAIRVEDDTVVAGERAIRWTGAGLRFVPLPKVTE